MGLAGQQDALRATDEVDLVLHRKLGDREGIPLEDAAWKIRRVRTDFTLGPEALEGSLLIAGGFEEGVGKCREQLSFQSDDLPSIIYSR